MSTAIITWDDKGLENQLGKKLASLKWIGRVIFIALLLILLDGALNLLTPLVAGRIAAERVEQATRWVLFWAAICGSAGTIILLRMLAKFRTWYSDFQQEALARLKDEEKLLATASLTLRNQVADAKAAEERLQKQNAELSEWNAQLQGELDKRKTAEKNLHEQRRELTRSKDVLEIHVQERTQEIQKLQHRYELILNSAGDGICGLDMNGKATFVNPAAARMTGWEVKELVGRPEQEIFGLSAVPADSEANGTNAKDQTFRRRDGSVFLAELNKTPIVENGREMGAVLVFKDITERRQAEETLAQKADELARSNAELEQFAFVASHDLQEPLRKIQAFGDRLKTKCEKIDLGEARDYLERMQNAAARMQTLINDLLAFSRVIRSSQPFVPVDLGAITKEVLGDLEVRIEKNRARVEGGELPTIDADPTQMRQLMQNLLSNALKFQPPKAQPVVKIKSRTIPAPPWDHASGGENGAAPADNSLCEISVEDNGIGFDEKHLEKIFAVFQRLHGRTEYEGTGVGLAVCRRIADRHGGCITARSQPGKGATFVVTFPVHAAATTNSK
jgi:PAS domain S-box-containing protein